MGFFGKLFSGKRGHDANQLRQSVQHMPDSDGVSRVFPKELWDDPAIGAMLRECGYNPDDPKNILNRPQD